MTGHYSPESTVLLQVSIELNANVKPSITVWLLCTSRYSCTFSVSSVLSKSSPIRHFKHDNAIEIHNKMILDFYPGLPFLYLLIASLQLKCWSAKYWHPLAQGLCITGCTGIYGSAKYNVIRMNQPIMEVYWYECNTTNKILTWTNVHAYIMWELECFTYTCIYMGSTVRN